MEMIQSISEKVISRPVLIGIMYALSFGWLVSFIVFKARYKKLLEKCNDLQEKNVKLGNLNEDLNDVIAAKTDEINNLKGD